MVAEGGGVHYIMLIGHFCRMFLYCLYTYYMDHIVAITHLQLDYGFRIKQ